MQAAKPKDTKRSMWDAFLEPKDNNDSDSDDDGVFFG